MEYLDSKTVSALREEGRIELGGKVLAPEILSLVSEDCFPVVLRGWTGRAYGLFLALDKDGTGGTVDLSPHEIRAKQIRLYYPKEGNAETPI